MKQWPKRNRHHQMGMNNLHVLKASHNPVFVNLIIAGTWKRIKKKGYDVAVIGWSIDDKNRVLAQDGQKIEALDACQAEVKAIFVSLQKAIYHQIRSIKIYTSCMGIINAISSHPACRIDLVTLCRDIKRIANDLEYRVIEKFSKEKTMNVKRLAADFRKIR